MSSYTDALDGLEEVKLRLQYENPNGREDAYNQGVRDMAIQAAKIIRAIKIVDARAVLDQALNEGDGTYRP